MNEMVQWVRTIASKPDELSSVPGTHVLGMRELIPLSCPPHSHAYTHKYECKFYIDMPLE